MGIRSDAVGVLSSNQESAFLHRVVLNLTIRARGVFHEEDISRGQALTELHGINELMHTATNQLVRQHSDIKPQMSPPSAETLMRMFEEVAQSTGCWDHLAWAIKGSLDSTSGKPDDGVEDAGT